MEPLDLEVKVGHGERVYVQVFSDIHRAALGCNSKKLREEVKKAADAIAQGEKRYILLGGDLTNGTGVKHPHFDNAAIAPEFKGCEADDLYNMERDVLAAEFEPVKDNILAVCAGNHDLNVMKRLDYNFPKDLAREMGACYAGYSTFVRFRLKYDKGKAVSTLLFYWHHGWGAGRTTGSKANMMEKMALIAEADVYGCGHVHQEIDFRTSRLECNRRGAMRVVDREKLFFNSSTFLNNYGALKRKKPLVMGQYEPQRTVAIDYGEVKGYAPSTTGTNGFWMALERRGRNEFVIEKGKVEF